MEVLIIAISSLVLVLTLLKSYVLKMEKQDECEHKNTFTYVDSVVVTCETTTITCLDCGKRLSTKTDCR